MEASNSNPTPVRKPNWLRVKLPTGTNYRAVRNVVDQYKLHTICESGRCPNMGECWGEGTATFMILGNICTRSCGFCNVATGRPLPVDWDEPDRVARSIQRMKIKHAVLTSVDRDDLADGGSIIWAETVAAVRRLSPGTTMETYHKHLADHTITDILNEIPVSAGDAFFIPPGLVHAIGAGVVLAEIQQTSDVTYRLFDWDRPDDNGQMRALHIDEAEKALVFHDLAQVACTPKGLIEDQVKVVYESLYFSTSVMRLTRPIVRNYYQNDSFVVLMCTRGSLTLSSDGLALMQMRKGESVLVPAEIASIQISTQDAEILEVFVP